MNIAKEKASNYYKNGKYRDAIREYTNCIELCDMNSDELHTLYSNRCASYLQMNDVINALDDAQSCVRLKPTWAKGMILFLP
jgi:stress-induced-phosphoprotein 1